ncbi:aldo/keto reductase family oxidoreductase [Alloscardovia omnicolens]|uniref:aldo/keto reductase n=1 Tax=Alloscardovia omnicolens TaxID=419015 RepID=UPI003A63FF56
MKSVTIGRSDVTASAVAQGVMRMAEKSVSEAEKITATALESGINFFDTADVYTDGESSRKLGQALKNLQVDRSQIFVQTKVGIAAADETGSVTVYDFSKQRILDRVNYELKNLQTDYVDFLLLHRPDTLLEPDEINEAFAQLKAEGKVRHFGVSNMSVWQTEFLQSELDEKLHVNQLQLSVAHSGMIDQNIYTNMEETRSVDRDSGLLEYSRLRHMTIQAWSPLQAGFFGGTFVDNPEFPELNAKLEELADKYNSTKNGIAVAWLLRHPSQMQVIIGSMNTERISQFAAGADVQLSRQEWYELYAAAGNLLP